MAVPAGDERDWKFAKTFNLQIPEIFDGKDTNAAVFTEKTATLCNSESLNGLTAKEGIPAAIELLEAEGVGSKQINYRLRDAVFSRQRYWGEPFPICYENEIPRLIDSAQVTLPEVDAYLPTADGEPPLARAKKEDWNVF